MRILYLNHNVAWSGTFFRAYQLGRELVRRGHEVTVVTTRRSGRFAVTETVRDGVRLIQMPDLWWGPARNGFDPWNTLRRVVLLRHAECDLVHAFDSRPVVVFPALWVRARSGARLCMDWADWWGRGGAIQERSGWLVRTIFGPIETWFEETFRHRADGTTVISSALAERAAGLGIPRERILSFPVGCDVAGIQPMPRAQARRALRLAPDQAIVVHLGVLRRLDEDLLFDAFRALRTRVPAAQLVLIGNARASVPEDLKRTGAIRTTGFVPYDEVSQWLGAADLCVISMLDTVGNRGRWPGKINDYLAAGRPVVMTRVGDAARIVEEGKAGWTAEPTPRGFADVLAEALANPEARDVAGRCARSIAETTLSWGTLASELEKFYARITLERPDPAPRLGKR
jgi:glycosyltransferase involved in cell wall biosynthesis